MYLDPKLFAMLVAMLHVMLKHNPDARAEILELTASYQEDFFVPNVEAAPAVQAAMDHMLRTLGE